MLVMGSAAMAAEEKESDLEQATQRLTKALEKLAASSNVTWVNLAPFLKDDNGQLRKELTEDGLHLNGRAYYLWYSVIRKYLP